MGGRKLGKPTLDLATHRLRPQIAAVVGFTGFAAVAGLTGFCASLVQGL